jgi:hypothetical protein
MNILKCFIMVLVVLVVLVITCFLSASLMIWLGGLKSLAGWTLSHGFSMITLQLIPLFVGATVLQPLYEALNSDDI